MPVPDNMHKDRKQYLKNYRNEHIKRIPLDVQKSFYDNHLKPAADAVGETVNGYIKKAIELRLDSTTFTDDGEKAAGPDADGPDPTP